MAPSVRAAAQLTIDIGTEVRTQNSLLDDMVSESALFMCNGGWEGRPVHPPVSDPWALGGAGGLDVPHAAAAPC